MSDGDGLFDQDELAGVTPTCGQCGHMHYLSRSRCGFIVPATAYWYECGCPGYVPIEQVIAVRAPPIERAVGQ